MKYDFTSIIDRNGKDAIAMDVEAGCSDWFSLRRWRKDPRRVRCDSYVGGGHELPYSPHYSRSHY